MAAYLLIESRDPFTSRSVDNHYELAAQLKSRGNEVTLFLVENGVLAARRGPRADALAKLSAAGVAVKADSYALRERGIGADRLASGVESTELDFVVDQLAAGTKTIWH